MSLSYVQYVADGNTDEFDVPFPFASRTHVKVTINGAPPVLPIRWAGESRIKINDVLPDGSLVELRRETPISSRLVDFQNGSVLTEEDLDTAFNQLFYLQQELRDYYKDTLEGRLAEIAAGGGYDIPDGADVIDELANHILATQAAMALQQAIQDIALNGNTIADLAWETAQLETALQQLGATTTGLQTSLQNSINTVDSRVSTLRTDHDQLVSVVDALAGGDPGTGLATLIQNEANARIAGDTAITDTIALIGAKSGDNLSFVIDTNTAKVSPTETLAEKFSALSATDSSNTAAILAEQTARIDADGAISNTVSLLDARVGTNEAAILTEQTARADGDSANASAIAAINLRVDGAEADIISEQNARAAADGVLTTNLDGLSARMTTAEGDINAVEASVIAEQNARVSADNAIASDVTALTARVTTAEGDITAAEAAIAAESTARANAISAEATARNALTATVNTKNRTFRQGTTPSATAVGDLWINTSDSNKVYRWSGSAWVETSDTRIAANTAAIIAEQTVRADADSANATAISGLLTRVDTAEANIISEQNARVSGDSALTSSVNALGARVTTAEGDITAAEAAIVQEQIARANGDNSLASSISTLQTTVNGNTASVTTLQSSVNGLEAKYGVALDVNGHVTGFVQNNDGTTGSFTILADRFAIIDPNGGTPIVPFEVSGGYVFINGNLVVDGSISSTKIADNAVTDIDYYFSSFGTLSTTGSTNVWRSSAASVTVVAPTNSVGVMLDLVAQLDRGGSTDDTLSFRIYRSDGVVLPQVYSSCKVEGGRRPYCFKFTDSNPPSGSVTYTLQVLSSDDWPTWYDTTLTAALFKK